MSLATRAVLVIVLVALLVGGAVFAYVETGHERTPLTFSPTQLLGATWVSYKEYYIEPTSGRTIDPSRGNVTTSEGESYTMLRAVWMGDKPGFDAAWRFTKGNLQHSGDHLFSWLYGKRPDGTYGVLTSQNGHVSASDADQDIALSLVFAYARWQDPAYLADARAIIQDIWAREVIMVQGTPYLVADDQEKASNASVAVVNPSYLSPASYRIFRIVDPSHPWESVADSSYRVLGDVLAMPLDASKSAGIPADWVALDKRTGRIQAATGQTTSTNFGFDAIRVPWRLALDYGWYGDQRDLDLLGRMNFLKYTWESAGAIGETYAHDGTPVDPSQSTALYGATLGYFMLADRGDANAIYRSKLLPLYNPDINDWRSRLSYYDDNWAWFGIALYNRLLPNLAAAVPSAAWST